VVEWIDQNLSGSDIERCKLVWPEIDQNNGRPKQEMVITICKGSLALEQIATEVANTDMFPIHAGDTLVSSIGKGEKNQIKASLNAYGFNGNDPYSTANDWQEVIVNLIRIVDPTNSGTTAWVEAQAPTEFG